MRDIDKLSACFTESSKLRTSVAVDFMGGKESVSRTVQAFEHAKVGFCGFQYIVVAKILMLSFDPETNSDGS